MLLLLQGRDYDPNRERAEVKKLSKKLKRERKGAARELRKDQAFIQSEKAKIDAHMRKKKEQKRKEVWNFQLEQQRDSNIYSRMSKKAKDAMKNRR